MECCGTFELLGNGSVKATQADVFGWYNNTGNELHNERPLFSNTNGNGFIAYAPNKNSWIVSFKKGISIFNKYVRQFSPGINV